MNIKERIAYIRGLMEGSDFCGKDVQAKAIWENLLRVCDELADSVAGVQEDQEELEEYVEAIDSDLSELEGDVYTEDDEPCECDICEHEAEGHTDDEDYSESDPVVEMECPKCGESVVFEESFLYDADVEISCPECGSVVYATGQAAQNGVDLLQSSTEESKE